MKGFVGMLAPAGQNAVARRVPLGGPAAGLAKASAIHRKAAAPPGP